MRISVVTISYNQSKFLPRCLESIRLQDWHDYEHIVVDPGSTDGSLRILADASDDQLRVVHMPDGGPADGLNNGFARVTGDVVMYVNADDELAPGAFVAVAAFFEKNRDVDVLVANGWLIDEESNPVKFVRSDRFSPFRTARAAGTFLQQGTAYRRQCLEARPFRSELKYTWDLGLMLDLHARGARLMNYDACVGYFRSYPDTISGNQALRERVGAERRLLLNEFLSVTALRSATILALPSRAVKKAKNELWLRQNPQRFPGSLSMTF